MRQPAQTHVTKSKPMFITFETSLTFISIQVDKRLTAYDDESLVYEACQQLGTDYEDYEYRKPFPIANVASVNWQPVVNRFRSENTTIKRQRKLGELRGKSIYSRYC